MGRFCRKIANLQGEKLTTLSDIELQDLFERVHAMLARLQKEQVSLYNECSRNF